MKKNRSRKSRGTVPLSRSKWFYILVVRLLIKIKKKLAGPPVYYSRSTEPSLAPQFKWLDNTFKGRVSQGRCLSCGIMNLIEENAEPTGVHDFLADLGKYKKICM